MTMADDYLMSQGNYDSDEFGPNINYTELENICVERVNSDNSTLYVMPDKSCVIVSDQEAYASKHLMY